MSWSQWSWHKRKAYQKINGGLDPWPKRRPVAILIMFAPEGCFLIDALTGRRILRVPRTVSGDEPWPYEESAL